MLPITRMISKYNHYETNVVKYIIIHYTGNNTDSAKNNAIYFNGGNRNASAHYFVDDVSIYQVVEDNKGAWHIGNSKTAPNNQNSLGVEMCCKNGVVTEKTEENTLQLVKYLMKKYNVPIANVRTHAEVTNYGKTCPNWNANGWQRWKNFKNKLVSTPSTTTSVKVGDKVKVKSTATTYANSTKNIPQWVKNGTYTVSKINGSKVLLKEITSWVNVNDVNKVSTTSTTTTTSYLVRVTVDSLNVRKSPTTSSAIVTTVKKGGVYTIVEVSNGWGKLKSGTGWISLDCTEKVK